MLKKSLSLIPFEESLNQVDCQIKIQNHQLSIQYQVNLSTYLEVWEQENSSLKRKIGLWKGTCFEAFLRDQTSGEYLEFNFSGTGQWNVFYFKAKGQELCEYMPLKLTYHRFIKAKRQRIFEFSFKLTDIPFQTDPSKLTLGLSTILCCDDDEVDYFAIEHKQEQPDFHDEHTFIKLSE